MGLAYLLISKACSEVSSEVYERMSDSDQNDRQYLNTRSVAVVGAGVSGVATAVHLQRAGLDVTVYERTSRAGGVWVFDERVAKDAAYPSVLPSIGDSPDDESSVRSKRCDSPMGEDAGSLDHDASLHHAPPGPCYKGLKNNVSTTEMEMQCHAWKSGTEDFVSQSVLADYIQDAAIANDIQRLVQYDTKVEQITKSGSSWTVRTSKLDHSPYGGTDRSEREHNFDAVVVACGHYHACNIPDIPGLSQWKRALPDRIQHSKLYRRPDHFKDRNVLLVGAGVSSTDIAKELGLVAKTVYQISRGGMYDLPSHLLPANAARIRGTIKAFERLEGLETSLQDQAPIPGTITLESGQQICDIHHVILCTGYHVSLPFMRQHHADHLRSAEADDKVLVTDGQQTHNLHKDIFYIPDPTLAFVGVPYHVATFSFFEFQAIALAQVFAGNVPLPVERGMRREYRSRISEKGAGRTFHSMKKQGAEIAYVDDLARMVNEAATAGKVKMQGHSVKWHEAYARRLVRQKAIFSATRDPAIDQELLKHSVPCS